MSKQIDKKIFINLKMVFLVVEKNTNVYESWGGIKILDVCFSEELAEIRLLKEQFVFQKCVYIVEVDKNFYFKLLSLDN